MADYFLVDTDDHCVVRTYDGRGKPFVEERYPGIPQIISSKDGYLVAPNRWLMKRASGDDMALGSVRHEAMALRSFLQYLDALGRHWMTVDDDVLKAWRGSLRLRRHIGPQQQARGARAHRTKRTPASNNHVNSYLTAVFQFYVWCEETGLVSGIVNLTGTGISHGGINCKTVSVVRKNGERQTVRRCSLLLTKSGKLPRRTPSDEEIAAIHQQLSGMHAERNALILLFGEETGARRGDILQLLVSNIPDLEAILAATRDDRLLPLTVIGKRRIVRQINLKPGTALLLRQWVDLERAAIVQRARVRNASYKEPKEVFLSDRGTPLNPNWVSNLVTKLFRSAGMERATLHRLRAAFLTRLANGFVNYRDAYGEPLPLATIHFYVREIAGWTSLASLENYITAAYRRSLTTADDLPNRAFSEDQLAAILGAAEWG